MLLLILLGDVDNGSVVAKGCGLVFGPVLSSHKLGSNSQGVGVGRPGNGVTVMHSEGSISQGFKVLDDAGVTSWLLHNVGSNSHGLGVKRPPEVGIVENCATPKICCWFQNPYNFKRQ